MTRKVFETATVDLKVRGLHYFQHPVEDITPAEFLLLQDLHGTDAVAYLKKGGVAMLRRNREDGKWEQRPLTPPELREKLTIKYGEARVKSIFPNKLTGLPWTFADIGVGVGKNGFHVDTPEVNPDEEVWDLIEESSESEADRKAREKAEARATIDAKSKKAS